MFVPPIDPTKTICLTPAALADTTNDDQSSSPLNTHTKTQRDENTNQRQSDSSDQSNQPAKRNKWSKTKENEEIYKNTLQLVVVLTCSG